MYIIIRNIITASSLVMMSSTMAWAQGFSYPLLADYSAVAGNNFVRTYIPQKPTDDPGAISLANQLVLPCVVTTQYYDGIGRPLQEVMRSGVYASGQPDLVSVHTYDNVGRESIKYLPYSIADAVPGNKGKLKTTPTQLGTQYNTIYPGNQPFSQTVFDNSPLNRVTATLAQGAAWVGSGTAVNYSYTANTYGDQVPQFSVGPVKNDPPVMTDYYADGKLFITKVVDEDGHESLEYKDMLGRVIMKKQKDGATYATTAFAYDDMGHLRWAITPEAFNQGVLSAAGSTLQSILKGLCYNYFYDKRGRLVEKTIPGKEVEYFVYDKYDRVVLTQNGNLRKCGLPIYTGPILPLGIPYGGGGSDSTGDSTSQTGGGDSTGNGGSTGLNPSGQADSTGSTLDSTTTNPNSPFDSTSYNPNSPFDSTSYSPGANIDSTGSGSDTSGHISLDTPHLPGSGGGGGGVGDPVITVPMGTPDVPVTTEGSGLCTWLFTCYDILDRQVMTGLYKAPYNVSRETMQSIVDNGTGIGMGTELMYYLYNDQFNNYPATFSDANIWTINYYDDYTNAAIATYSFTPAYNAQLTGPPAFSLTPATASKQTRGLLTGTKTAIIDASSLLAPPYNTSWLRKVNFYDDKARLIQTIGTNHCNGMDINTNQYDFAGNLMSSVLHNTNPLALAIATTTAPASAFQTTDIVKTYTIDHYSGKPISLTQKINGAVPHIINSFTYDNLGRVSNKNLHVADNFYSYNIRGWLTGINADYFNANLPNIFFREKLTYNSVLDFTVPASNAPLGGATEYLNGNIGQCVWQHYGPGANIRSYKYVYDDMSRVRSANFSQRENATGSWTWTKENTDYTMTNVSYDLNGNIKTMDQRGDNPGAGTGPVDMDLMNYAYFPNSNQLRGVQDNGVVTTNPDFKDDGSSSYDDYGYDANGNVTADNNKGIPFIEYSYLDKPKYFMVPTKGHIWYLYDAQGNKLQKRILNEGGVAGTTDVTTIDYVGPFQYKNRELQNISHEEGRCRPIVSPAGSVSYVYDYFIKDHLTNVRSIVTAEGFDGLLFYDPTNTSVSPSGNTPLGGGSTGGTSGGVITWDPLSFVTTYLATHEVAAAYTEGALFNNIDVVRANKPGSTDSADSKAVTLDGADPNKRTGTSLMLQVMPGDQFEAEAQSYYEEGVDSVSATVPDIVDALFKTLAGGATYAGVPIYELPQNAQILQGTFGDPGFASAYADIVNATYDSSRPAAFLNYIVLNKSLKIIPEASGAIQVNADGGTWNPLATAAKIVITEPGYVIFYVNSASKKLISFDRIKVNYYKGAEIEEDHYYPFGLNLSISSPDPALANNIKYNSKELQHNEFANAMGVKSGLELYDYGARMHDPQIGRWNGIDEKAEKHVGVSPYTYAVNNPVMFIDNDGKDNVIYIINLQSSGITADQVQKMADVGNQAFKDIGLETRMQVYTGDPSTFKSYLLDKTDAVAVIGQKDDMVSYIQKFDQDYAKLLNSELEPGVIEATSQGGRNADGAWVDRYIVAIEPYLMQREYEGLSVKNGLAVEGALTILHGAWHTSSFGQYGIADGHTTSGDNIIARSGHDIQFGSQNLRFYFNNKPLNGLNRNDGFKKDMIGRFGNHKASDNYNKNKAKYEYLKNKFHFDDAKQGTRLTW